MLCLEVNVKLAQTVLQLRFLLSQLCSGGSHGGCWDLCRVGSWGHYRRNGIRGGVRVNGIKRFFTWETKANEGRTST